jgi:hypothetical protein
VEERERHDSENGTSDGEQPTELRHRDFLQVVALIAWTPNGAGRRG